MSIRSGASVDHWRAVRVVPRAARTGRAPSMSPPGDVVVPHCGRSPARAQALTASPCLACETCGWRWAGSRTRVPAPAGGGRDSPHDHARPARQPPDTTTATSPSTRTASAASTAAPCATTRASGTPATPSSTRCGAATRTSRSPSRSRARPRRGRSRSAAARARMPCGWPRQGWTVTAIDPSGVALARARAAAEAAGADVAWRQGGLLDVDLPEGGFDLVSVFYPALDLAGRTGRPARGTRRTRGHAARRAPRRGRP